MPDLSKKVFHIEMFLLQPHFARLGSFGSLCVAGPQICPPWWAAPRMCCTRADCNGRMLSKQQDFQEKRCCVEESTLQNLFVLSYSNTTYISITINAFSDTLSGASPSDKNVSVTSEKTAPRYHQGMNFVGSILQHSTFFLRSCYLESILPSQSALVQHIL